MSLQAVGLLAGTLTTAAWIPQVARTFRNGTADDLSWSYLVAFAAGVSTWILYALLTDDLPVLAANVVSVVLIGSLVSLKARHRVRTRRLSMDDQPSTTLRNARVTSASSE